MHPPYPSASLYVGDLASDVSEGHLFEIFNRVGPVALIRVCRDAVTRRSLGYAYVNFHSPVDAERALDTLNNTLIKNKPCRIMWSQRDPSLRKSGVGNIFIKNLDKTIDHKALHDTFSVFGNILSCKVALDSNGASKGYGFVHYETQEMADEAISKVNGKMLKGKTIFVGNFIPKKERSKNSEESKYTNIYVKNLDENISDEKLKELFSSIGPVSSAVVMSDGESKSKGFGFVNFENHEHAVKAIEEFNGKVLSEGGKTLFVGKAQKKSEREAELRQKFDQRKERPEHKGVNLYIKNLDDDVDDEKLRSEFAKFGNIASVKVMKDEKGNSKGFGFVCFETTEAANQAVAEMRGKLLGSKPLYVAIAQKKDYGRRGQMDNLRTGNGISPPQLYASFTPPVFYAQAQAYQKMVPRNRWPAQYPVQNYMMPMQRQQRNSGRQNYNNRRFNSRNRDQQQQQQQQTQQPFSSSGLPEALNSAPLSQPTITHEHLAQLPPDQQVHFIAERLYPLIEKEQPIDAGKITGMLLEQYPSPTDLLLFLENPQALHDKIYEAVDVLQQAQGHAEENQE